MSVDGMLKIRQRELREMRRGWAIAAALVALIGFVVVAVIRSI